MMWLLATGFVPEDLLRPTGATLDPAWLGLLTFLIGYWVRGVLTRSG